MGPNQGGRSLRNYTDKAIKCSECGGEFFEKLSVNKYRTNSADIYNGQKEINPEHRVSLLRCITCEHVRLPEISYSFVQPIDQEILNEIKPVLEKREELFDEVSVPEGQDKV